MFPYVIEIEHYRTGPRDTMSTTENLSRPAHLQGNGAPVHDELTITGLRVSGAIPPELNGRYLRNGANPFTGMSATRSSATA